MVPPHRPLLQPGDVRGSGTSGGLLAVGGVRGRDLTERLGGSEVLGCTWGLVPLCVTPVGSRLQTATSSPRFRPCPLPGGGQRVGAPSPAHPGGSAVEHPAGPCSGDVGHAGQDGAPGVGDIPCAVRGSWVTPMSTGHGHHPSGMWGAPLQRAGCGSVPNGARCPPRCHPCPLFPQEWIWSPPRRRTPRHWRTCECPSLGAPKAPCLPGEPLGAAAWAPQRGGAGLRGCRVQEGLCLPPPESCPQSPPVPVLCPAVGRAQPWQMCWVNE